MLKEINYQNKEESIYMCDRCKRKVKATETYKISIEEPCQDKYRKRWDLCSKCFRALVKGIEKCKEMKAKVYKFIEF